VPVSRIQDLLHGRRKMTADTSLRLARYFGVSDLYFLNIQNDLDIRRARMEIEKDLADIVPVSKLSL
jgi:addiction module HigA family antidote